MLVERHIRSFVRREGRMTDRQKMAINIGAEKYILSKDEKFIPQEIFEKKSPLVLEIGFGMGQTLFELAKANPNKNYVGIEVHRPGVGALLASVEEEGLQNIRIYAEDAALILKQCILPQTFSEVLIYFPDPWPKKRHHKRRLIQIEFIRQILIILKPEGILHCATDWENYAHHMMEVLSSIPELKNTAGEGKFLERSEALARRPETKFERRGQRLGHGIYDLVFTFKPLSKDEINV